MKATILIFILIGCLNSQLLMGQSIPRKPRIITSGPIKFCIGGVITLKAKLDTSYIVSTLAGSVTPGYINGIGVNARFRRPRGLCLDHFGNIIVADSYNYSIRKITKTGVVSTIAGTDSSGYVDGPSTIARFSGIGCPVIDKTGNIFVSDYGFDVKRKIDRRIQLSNAIEI